MIAEARAKMAAQGAKAEAEPESELPARRPSPSRTATSTTARSRRTTARSSRCGPAGPPPRCPPCDPRRLPGESMSERDVIREVSGSRRAIVVAVVGVVVAAIVAAVLWMMRDRPSLPPAPAPTAHAVPAPPPPGGAPATACRDHGGKGRANPAHRTAAVREPGSRAKRRSVVGKRATAPTSARAAAAAPTAAAGVEPLRVSRGREASPGRRHLSSPRASSASASGTRSGW